MANDSLQTIHISGMKSYSKVKETYAADAAFRWIPQTQIAGDSMNDCHHTLVAMYRNVHLQKVDCSAHSPSANLG